jgi:hypothetical protein
LYKVEWSCSFPDQIAIVNETAAFVPLIAVTFPRIYAHGATDANPSEVEEVPRVREIVASVSQFELSLLTSTAIVAAPVEAETAPLAWNVFATTGEL